MNVKEALDLFRYHQKSNLKQRSQATYKYIIGRFESSFAERPIESIGTDEICQELTQNTATATRYLRYAQIKAFFSFAIEQCHLNMNNPCNGSLISKAFRMSGRASKKILAKETVDEMIYNTKSQRDRLILELMARCGLKVGELLKIKVSDISDRKITLREPKSGRET